MNYRELQKAAHAYLPALLLRDSIYVRLIYAGVSLFFIILLFLGALSLLLFFGGNTIPFEALTDRDTLIYGVFLFTAAIWSIFFAFYSFYNYYAFRDIAENSKKENTALSFEAAQILWSSGESDLTAGFFRSPFGSYILARNGVDGDMMTAFLRNRQNPLTPDALQFEEKSYITAYAYSRTLYSADPEFADFLFENGIRDKEFLGASRWVESLFLKQRKQERWWSKENLRSYTPIGTDWSHGVAYELEKFSQTIEERIPVSASLEHFHEDEIGVLETVLSRQEGANALLVGEAGTGKLSVVGGLASLIQSEKVLDALAFKKIHVLDTNALIAATGEKNTFEQELVTLMNQLTKAGNVILVIDNLPTFIHSAESFGSDVISLLDPYLGSAGIQVIALSDTASFHNTLQAKSVIVKHFENILLEETDESATLTVIEDTVLELERQYGLMFTFPALTTLIRDAERYIPSGVMPDKALDVLYELAPKSASEGKAVVLKEDVESFINQKTGVPVGSVSSEEKELLSQLEEILHKRVVGQDMAIDTISNALRRARSGISDPDRPIGTFLFIGPTGVGKTEVSKALSEAFFESEKSMSRLDMSEYQGPDALTRLIGSFETEKAGALSALLKENPYSVLLLDEFEKADPEVHDLFLQILDEGVFTDSFGKKINARNSIIIATSNAGSDLIWEYEQKGEALKEKRDEIIDSIIKSGVFKPELLNRFDSVVLFHSLKDEHLHKVAQLMLNDLSERIKERGYKLSIGDGIVEYLVEVGSDPKFGARALNREVQDTIEKVVADKILNDNLKQGATISITRNDIE